jgi:putative membrane protein
MVLRLLLRLVVSAVIIGIVAKIVPGIHIHGGFGALLWIAVLFSFVNVICGPLLRLIGLPLIVLTLGLFFLVIDAGLLGITAALSSHLDIDSFGAALLGGVLIAICGWVAEIALPLRRGE